MSPPIACLDNETVLAFVERRLPVGPGAIPAAAIEAHIAGCSDCRKLVAEAAKFHFQSRPATASAPAPRPTSSGERAEAPKLAAGATVSRYVIERPIGLGGGGVVYQAFDPQLKRRVACKLVRAHRLDPASPTGSTPETRLLREAEAMAQLAHPNVVNVYDAGTHEGQVFIVMELVEGETLGRWLRRQPRTWREIVEAFVAAGRGLAAAHAVGLIHRDIKPENILIGSDGRARVTDFGLARPVSVVQAADPVPDLRDVPGPSSESGPITTSAGTPIYMAPEQFVGAVADRRTDQFSFCVTLFSALHGRHPFGKVGRWEPAAGPAPDERGGFPSSISALLARGLSINPDARFASMDEIVVLLERALAPAPRLRGRTALVLGAAAVVGVAAVALWAARPGSRHTPGAIAAVCGNRQVDPGEECDDGNASAEDACVACRWARCGDGNVWRTVEECDPGPDAGQATGGRCSASCLRCGTDAPAFVWAGNDHCYTLHEKPLPWSEAEAACGARGGALVTYSATFESRALYEAFFTHDKRPYWIGMAHTEARPAWITGDPLHDLGSRTPPQETEWEKGYPDQRRGTCVQATPVEEPNPNPSARGASNWANAPCDRPLPFLCERTGWTIRPATHHAYQVFPNPSFWREARAFCQARGAHLVSITDAEEQAFVASLTLAVDVWIGATDEHQEGRFEWTTGEPFRLSGFAPGEPDNQFGNDDYVLLGLDKAWHDRTDSARLPFMCEID